MPQPFQSIYNLDGGLNNSTSDEAIDLAELSDCSNYIPDMLSGGKIIKREGLTPQSNGLSFATFTSVFCGVAGNYFTAGVTIYDFTGTALKTLSNSDPVSWTSFAGYDLMVNGTDELQTVDGTTFTSISGMPAGVKYLASANNFVYYAGHQHGELAWSTPGSITSWPLVNALTLTADENDDIIGLGNAVNAVFILLNRSFEMVSGSAELGQGVSYYSKGVGGKSNQSILTTPDGLFWWSESGIVWLKFDFTLDLPMIRKIPATLGALNRAMDSSVHACFDPYQRRVSFWLFNGASQTTTNMRLDYYYAKDTFWTHQSGLGTQMAASGKASLASVTANYCGGYGASYLYKMEGATDDGTPIDSFLETKRDSGANDRGAIGATIYKLGRKQTVQTNLETAEDFTYSCYVDSDDTINPDNEWTFQPEAGPNDTILGLNRQHRKIKHRLEDSAPTRTRITSMVMDAVTIRSV